MANLLVRLERAIEGLVEGLFSHHFHGRVQPLEIARRLTRAVEDHKLVGVNQVFAPNEFLVALHPEDYKTLEPFQAAVIPELVSHLEEYTRESNYQLLGKSRIVFEPDQTMERGGFLVEARFRDKTNQPAEAPAPTTALAPKEIPRLKVKGVEAALRVMEGPDAGAEYSLTRVVMTIGRGNSNDVALTDTNVSRSHAKVELQPDGFHLKDLGSKNGSFVNGAPASDTLLGDGDHITMGATLFHFKSVRVL